MRIKEIGYDGSGRAVGYIDNNGACHTMPGDWPATAGGNWCLLWRECSIDLPTKATLADVHRAVKDWQQ